MKSWLLALALLCTVPANAYDIVLPAQVIGGTVSYERSDWVRSWIGKDKELVGVIPDADDKDMLSLSQYTGNFTSVNHLKRKYGAANVVLLLKDGDNVHMSNGSNYEVVSASNIKDVVKEFLKPKESEDVREFRDIEGLSYFISFKGKNKEDIVFMLSSIDGLVVKSIESDNDTVGVNISYYGDINEFSRILNEKGVSTNTP